jgi:glycosyltransferase involved in cell wall biosynthesis
MATICFVTTCMGRLNALRQTLGTVVCQPGCSVVVVDYSCPDGTGAWVEQQHPQVRVVRVPGQEQFHVARARNAGAAAADAPWLCFCDADIRLAAEFAGTLAGLLRPGRSFRPQPIPHGAAGTLVVARTDFERIGGYDEIYQGYGGEDKDLYQALQFTGVVEDCFPGAMLEHLPHSDLERVRFYQEDLRTTLMINRIYRAVKFDMVRRLGSLLPVEVRRGLYQTVREKVLPWFSGGGSDPLNISIRLEPSGQPGPPAARTIVYRVQRGAHDQNSRSIPQSTSSTFVANSGKA